MFQKTLARTVLEATVQLSQRDRARFLIFALAGFFFVVVSACAYTLHRIPNSPDEMANRAFATHFSETWHLRIEAPDIAAQYGLVPRSVTIASGDYVPATFYGLPVFYGVLGDVLDVRLVWLFTPFFVTLAGLGFFGLIRRIWGQRVGTIAGMLYYLHPVVWYYTVRGLYPNALFLSALLVSLYLAVVRPIRLRSPRMSAIAYALTCAASLGLALFVRPAEAVWVVPLYILLLVCTRAWRDRVFTLTWVTMAVLVLVGLFLIGGMRVFSVLRGGYVVGSLSWKTMLAPFGLHPRAVFWNSWWYLVLVPGFVTVTGLLGLIAHVVHLVRLRIWKTTEALYTFLFVVLAWYPMVMYGSWAFADNPTPWLHTIGDSHVRYWLPVMVFSLPFVAYGLTRAFDLAARISIRRAGVVWVGFFLMWFVQCYVTFYNGSDGYHALLLQQQYAQVVHDAVLSMVPPHALLVVDRWDKVFWPERTVAAFFSDKTQSALDSILARPYYGDVSVPVYFFGLALTPAQEEVLQSTHAFIMEKQKSFGDHALYQVRLPPVNH